MNETKFKVLMYNGFYVDIRLIEGGIYSSYIPCIYSKDKTIESLIEDGRRVNLIMSLQESSPKVFSDGTWTKFVSGIPSMMFWHWNIIKVKNKYNI